MKHWASWTLLCKGALLQFPLVLSSSELGPCALGSMVQLCMSSTGVGRKRERLPTCPFHADFLPSRSQPQLRTLVTVCWISPGPQEELDGWTCRLTGSYFLRGNCCFRYCAIAWLFGGLPLAPAIRWTQWLVPVCRTVQHLWSIGSHLWGKRRPCLARSCFAVLLQALSTLRQVLMPSVPSHISL